MADCTPSWHLIDRGEEKDLVICSATLPRDYVLSGLADSDISVIEHGYLSRCEPGAKTRGLIVTVAARAKARSARLRISGSDQPVCDIHLEVRPRQLLPNASLRRIVDVDRKYYLLTVHFDRSIEPASACNGEILFPTGKWPAVSMVRPEELEQIPQSRRPVDEPVECSGSALNVLVKVTGQQAYPAKVLLPQLKSTSGESIEGIAYAALPQPAWLSSMSEENARYIDVKGIRTRYFESGTGEVLILVHGAQPGDFLNDARVWKQNFGQLATHFRVIAPDRLAMGYTDNPKNSQAYEDIYAKTVEHLYDFIRALRLEKVHLVGHSMGGWPVTRLALDHPELVRCLVNVDSAVAPPHPKSLPFLVYLQINKQANSTVIRKLLELQTATANNITPDKISNAMELARLPKTIEAAEIMAKARMSPAHPKFRGLIDQAIQDIEAGKLEVPSLLVWGYDDRVTAYESALEFFSILNASPTESAFRAFNNAGHYVFYDHPEQFNQAIIDFCGRPVVYSSGEIP